MAGSSHHESEHVRSLLIAFPKSNYELHLVFSEPVDRASAEQPESYTTESGLTVLLASVASQDSRRVTLKTEPMNGEHLRVDTVQASGVRTASGAPLVKQSSPQFIQGIVKSILDIQKP